MTIPLHWWYVPVLLLGLALWFWWKGSTVDGWDALPAYVFAFVAGVAAVAVCLGYFLAVGLS